MNCYERSRTRCLDGDRRSFEVQLVSDARGQMIDAVLNRSLKIAGLLDELAIWQEIVEQVSVHARAGEDTDRALVIFRAVARVFERLPRALETDTTLRVHHFRVARDEAEE